MNWSDVTKPPPPKMLRQFAGLWLVFFLGAAALRWYRGHPDGWAIAMAVGAVVIGLAGLASPALIKPIYMGWMIAAFPIGWTVSRLVLGAVFFLVVTPFAWVFRLSGRDALRLRRPASDTYWMAKRRPGGPAEYFRQS